MNPSPLELVCNGIDQPYPSKKDYLGMQYALKRYEATQPLRSAVRGYKRDPDLTEDAFIFSKAFIIGYSFAQNTLAARLRFTTTCLPTNTDWNKSGCLKPGQMVALSRASDGFKKEVLVAIVATSPWEDEILGASLTQPRRPCLVDLIWTDPKTAQVDPSVEYVMLEARSGYFEAHRHILQGLQHAAREPGGEFDEYIVECENDIAEAVEDPCIISRTQLLDPSQRQAFDAMVTRDLALVQGPPGTGKTYTSLVALESLVETLRKSTGPPIIVASHTNHAVDQLLELVIEQLDASVVRLGSQSTSPAVQSKTLQQLRQSSKVKGGGGHYKERRDIEDQLKKCLDNIHSLDSSTTNAELLFQEGLITERQYKSLTEDDEWETSADSESVGAVLKWLGKYNEDRAINVNEDEEEAGICNDEDRIRVEIEREFCKPQGSFVPLKKIMSSIDFNVHLARKLLNSHQDLYKIKPAQRLNVYKYICEQMLLHHAQRFRHLTSKYAEISKKVKIGRWTKDCVIVQREGIQILGCTVTGLSKYRGLLTALQPRILMIEEASETQEANIAAALLPSLKRLILVGDHQQLAPHVDVRKLEGAPFHLDMSLSERLILRHRMDYAQLKVQRRMAPIIREVVSTFYPAIEDHASVEEREPVPGMGFTRLWWFQHAWPDARNADMSYHNCDEALMIIGFLKYLLKNGLQPKQITILTYYRGQIEFIKNKLDQDQDLIDAYESPEWSLRTVDGFQGEENDVILLSLVRGSSQWRAGFVQDENRAVVATSRARRGMFVFGNSDNVLQSSERSRATWQKVIDVFSLNRCLARALPVTCSRHGITTRITDLEDWWTISGGCRKPCGLTCEQGHVCQLQCHPENLPCRCRVSTCTQSKVAKSFLAAPVPVTISTYSIPRQTFAFSSAEALMQDYDGAIKAGRDAVDNLRGMRGNKEPLIDFAPEPSCLVDELDSTTWQADPFMQGFAALPSAATTHGRASTSHDRVSRNGSKIIETFRQMHIDPAGGRRRLLAASASDEPLLIDMSGDGEKVCSRKELAMAAGAGQVPLEASTYALGGASHHLSGLMTEDLIDLN